MSFYNQMPLDISFLKERGANQAQITKIKKLWPNLERNTYTEFRPWCWGGDLRIYFDAGFIAINNEGKAHVFCHQEFIKKKIVSIIEGI